MKKSNIRIFTCLLAVMLYCTAFSGVAFANGIEEDATPLPEAIATPSPTPLSVKVEGAPLSGDGNLVTRDLLYDKATNKQFITVETRGGNLFYMVIDYDKPLDEEGEQFETYFLNLVDERDLADIIEDTAPEVCDCAKKCVAGTVNLDCPLCKTDTTSCTGKEAPPAPEETPRPEPQPEQKPNSMGGPLLLLLLLALGGGGAFYYIKFVKNKPKAKAPGHLDEYGFDDEEDDEPEDAELPDDEEEVAADPEEEPEDFEEGDDV